jgi:hypothetical protein
MCKGRRAGAASAVWHGLIGQRVAQWQPQGAEALQEVC